MHIACSRLIYKRWKRFSIWYTAMFVNCIKGCGGDSYYGTDLWFGKQADKIRAGYKTGANYHQSFES